MEAMTAQTADPLQALLQASAATDAFPANSRYQGIDTAELKMPDGTVVYLRRRFLPSPESLTTQQLHTVALGDRLDNLAAQYLGDPELFWRLCDANEAMRPWDLLETPGLRLRIALPEGMSTSAAL